MSHKNTFWGSRLRAWTALDKPARISEVLFGLIMVLTFTGTISVSTIGKQEVRELLWAALGCNLAWGIVDAVMYLMGELIERAHSVNLLKKIKDSANGADARSMIRDNMTPLIAELMEDDEIDQLDRKLRQLPEISASRTLVFKNFIIAGQIFLLVFLSTFPVTVPFLFVNDVSTAMRVSNGVALLLLFAGGYSLAKYGGLRPVLTALAYTAIGVFLVALTMALGG